MINLDESIEKLLNTRASRQISSEYGLGIDLDKLVYMKYTQKPEELWKSPVELVEKSESKKFLNLTRKVSTTLKNSQLINKPKLPIHKESELKQISIYNITQSLESTKVTAISASRHLITLGYSSGKLVIFTYSGSVQNEIKLTKSPDAITSIEISQQETILLSSHESGSIIVYSIQKSKVQRLKFHYSAIVCLKFWKNTEDYFLSGDLSGKCIFTQLSTKVGKLTNSSFSLANGEIGGITSIAPFYKTSELVCKFSALVSVCGKEKIGIFSIEPSIENVFVVEKNENGQNLCCPYSCWLVRNGKILILIAWDNNISVFQYEEAGKEVFVCVNVVEMQDEVFVLRVFNEEMVAAVGKSQVFFVKFGKFFGNHSVNAVKKVMIRKITPQKLMKAGNEFVPLYQNSVFVDQQGILLISDNSLYAIRLLDWEGTLDALKEKCEWISCFALGLNFHRNKYSKVFKARNPLEVKTKLLTILKIYAKDILIPLKYRIWNSLELSINLNSFDLLNVELYEHFLTEGHSEAVTYFIQAIEHFVLAGELKQISEVFLNKMIDHYQNTNKIEVLETIIMHLDPLQVNTKAIEGICEMLSMTSAYFFISSCKNSSDFVIPLKVSFKVLRNKESLTEKFAEFYKIVWYLSQIAHKKCVNGKDIPDSIFSSVISNVKNWLKKSKFLIVMLEMDASVTLNLLYDFFMIPCEMDSSQISVHDLILSLFSLFPEKSVVYTQICLFTVTIFVDIKEDLDEKLHLKVIKHLLGCNFLLTNRKILALDLYHYISQYLSNAQKPLFGSFTLEQLDKILTKSIKKLKISKEDLEEVYRINSFLPYNLLMVHLCEQMKDYQNCFIFFTKSGIQSTREKVFNWVKKLISHLDEPQDFLKLLESFLPELGSINADKTLELIKTFFNKQFWTIFKSCKNSKKLQFLMIESVKRKLIPEEFIPEYVELLCIFDKTRVLAYLNSLPSSVPIELVAKCEQVCRPYKDLDVICFLLVQQKKIFSALEEIYFVMKKFQEKFNQKVLPKQADIQNYSKFIMKIHEICDGNLDDLEINEAKGIFTSLLHLLIDFYQSYNNLYNSDLQDLMKIFITSALHYINFEFLLQKASENSKSVPITIFKAALLNLFTKRTFYQKSLKIFRNIMNKELSEKTTKQFKVFQTGIESSALCNSCQKLLQSKQQVKIYPCGHSFHSACVKNSNCPNHKINYPMN